MNEEQVISAPKMSKGGAAFSVGSEPPKVLAEISITEDERIGTGLSELDRVLGGGLVKGCLS